VREDHGMVRAGREQDAGNHPTVIGGKLDLLPAVAGAIASAPRAAESHHHAQEKDKTMICASWEKILRFSGQ
jgi:hypothetical protein